MILSVKLTLLTDEGLEDLADFSYRVYLRDSGWTDWAESGPLGTPDSGNPIQAIEVTMNPTNDIE